MAGYFGYSMSNNAVSAYNDGEKPLSKWTKKEILEGIEEVNSATKEKIQLDKLTVQELRDSFLSYSSYHHTSKFYNTTDFYSIDEEKIADFTEEKFNKIINSRVKRVKISKEEIEREKLKKAHDKAKREYKRSCKMYSQNEFYIGDKSINDCTVEEIYNRVELLSTLMKEYSKVRSSCKYKTERGYINNRLKDIDKK